MFTGTYTAIVTPFKNGKIDEAAFERLITHQIKGGVDGIVPVGTTGESPTVDYEEHIHVIALAIKLERPGPVLVKENCIGRGRRFQLLKFRTLPHDPEAMLPSWNRHPTALGEILRFTRIESLPQLINVLRGEMSIIDHDGSPSFLD